MLKIIGLCAALGCTLALVGCASSQSTVFPQGRNVYTVVTTSSNSADANKGAMQKATEICQAMHKSPVVLNHGSKYQGAFSKKEAGALNAAARVATAVTPDFIPGVSSDTDYKVTMKFRCQA